MLPTTGPPPPSVKRNTQTIAWGVGRVFIYVMMSTAPGLDLLDFIGLHPLVVKMFPYKGNTMPVPFIVTITDETGDKMAAMLDDLIAGDNVIYKEKPTV
jgi:hypothetical protein